MSQRGLDIRYLAKAETDVVARCRIMEFDWTETQDVSLELTVSDTKDQVVAECTIPMYVSPRKKDGGKRAGAGPARRLSRIAPGSDQPPTSSERSDVG